MILTLCLLTCKRKNSLYYPLLVKLILYEIIGTSLCLILSSHSLGLLSIIIFIPSQKCLLEVPLGRVYRNQNLVFFCLHICVLCFLLKEFLINTYLWDTVWNFDIYTRYNIKLGSFAFFMSRILKVGFYLFTHFYFNHFKFYLNLNLLVFESGPHAPQADLKLIRYLKTNFIFFILLLFPK